MPRLTLPPKKKKSAKTNSAPESAEEYLALGVDLEGAAEKWRAGDVVKSFRFFVKAIDNYDEGLRRFQDFDMSYNKARIQYSISQHPALRTQYAGSYIDLLEQALHSHRRAQSLDPANSDVLFNTAQVLSSLAEATHEASGNEPSNAINLIDEAITLFQQCLLQQEMQYQESLTQAAGFAADEDGGVSLSQQHTSDGHEVPPDEPGPAEEWASVIEPVTTQSLLDTACALLDTLALSCTFLKPATVQTTSAILATANHITNEKIPKYLQDIDAISHKDVWLAGAHFRRAYLEASYRASLIDAQSYEDNLIAAYADTTSGPTNLAQSASYLTSYADALTALNGAFADMNVAPLTRWKSLTKALEYMTTATKAPDAENVPELHVGRGDIELLRFMLSSAPGLPDTLTNDKVRATLLKNAATYYSGAAAVARSSIMLSRAPVVSIAMVKEAVVKGMMGQGIEPLRELVKGGVSKDTMIECVGDMADESLISEELRQQILSQ
jgi:tetratricopeptide (TPR) repeat protein